MSQKDLAHGIVSAAYLSLIESGQRTPSEEVLRALAARLGVDLEHHDILEAAMRRMLAALLAGSHESASHDLTLATRIDPTSPTTRLMRARWDEYHEFYAVAQATYLDLCSELPIDSEVYALAVLGSCRCARSTGQSEQSVRLGMKVLYADSPAAISGDFLIELRGVVAGLLSARGEFAEALIVARLDHPGIEDSPWAKATSKWVESSTYQDTGQMELALMSAREALAAASEVNRPLSLARLQVINAFLEMRQPNFDPEQIVTLVEAAEPVFQQFRHATDLALCAAVRARLLGLVEGVPACIDAFKEVITELRRLDLVQAIQVCTNFAEMCLSAGLLDDARDALAHAEELLPLCDQSAYAARTWTAMGHLHEQLGNLEAAMHCMKQATQAAGLTAFLQRQPQTPAPQRQ